MAAATKTRGTEGIIELTSGGTTEEVPNLMSWTLDASASLSEDSSAYMVSNGDGGAAAGGAWSDSTVESRSWSITCEHSWQKLDDAGTAGILDVDDVGHAGTVILYPDSSTAGGRQLSGAVIVESVSITSETTSVINASVTLKGTGALTKAIVS